MYPYNYRVAISLEGVKIMKKFTIASIAIFTTITICLIALLIHVINRGGSYNVSFGFSEAKLVNEQNISLDEISSISIEYHADDVIFYTSDTNELILKEYMSFTPDKDQLASVTKSGDILTIKSDNIRFYIGFIRPATYSRTEVYLPSDYAGNLSVSTSSGDIDSDLIMQLASFKASSTSGDIKTNEVNADEIKLSSASGNITSKLFQSLAKFEASSTSGDIKIDEISADHINISTSSGSIILQKAEGKRQFTSTSGDIKILNGNGDSTASSTSGNITIKNNSGQLKATSSSGDIKITALSGGGDFKTTSGNINLEFLEDIQTAVEDISITASSGDITLKLPSMLSCDFSADTSSGDIRTFFDDMLSFNKKGNHAAGTIGDNPDTTIQINTSSGNIHLGKN
ncbi:MAG: DUF4097 domain-containing protein [Lachnospiraceae bacterium]|jgi:DUF4097 and DUF4098 domain-containing protein YvlB|nr:DUF4097 domain-containing protein [Lachnospiraceae bacterium]